MDHLSSNDPSTIIRMTRKARRELNVLMASKQYEFENMIEKGVIAMLSEQIEHRDLSTERSVYSSFLSNRYEKDKKKSQDAVDIAKDATGSAGIFGAGSNVVISGVTSATSAIQDAVEEKRLEEEAKQALQSAQILHYVNISPVQYGEVAKGVAKILSNRFQLTLLRLAPGELGYMKFAQTLVEFMGANIVKRLRENPGDIIRAFVDAAVPSSTDTFSYRTYLSGLHKQLQTDEEVEDVLRECGPAVRSLVGALEDSFDHNTGKIKRHSSYTILGVMAHAFIITGEGGVVQGLGTSHRKDEMLDGFNKYPAILLSSNENVSDLGFNFGTKVTGRALKNAHVIALKRLIPDFFERKSVYYVNPVNAMTQKNVESRAVAGLVFPEERDECPWTTARDNAWKHRAQKIHEAGQAVRFKKPDEETITTRRDAGRLTEMEFASYRFDASQAMKDVRKMTDEVTNIRRNANGMLSAGGTRSEKQLQAVESACYAALTTSEFMIRAVKCAPEEPRHLSDAVAILKASQSAIDATRELPLDEAHAYRKAITISNSITEKSRIVFDKYIFCEESLHVLLCLVQNLKDPILAGSVKRELQEGQSKKKKALRLSIEEHSEKALDIIGMSNDSFNGCGPNDLKEAQEKYQQARSNVEYLLDNETQGHETKPLIDIIQRCELETKKNVDDMGLALKHGCIYIGGDNDDGLISLNSEADVDEKIEEKVLNALVRLKEKVSEALKDAKNIDAKKTFFQFQKPFFISVSQFKEIAVIAKNESNSLLRRIGLAPVEGVSAEIDQKAVRVLQRAIATADLSQLLFVSGKEQIASLKESAPEQLDTALTELDNSVTSLSEASRRFDSGEPQTAYRKLKDKAAKLQPSSLFTDVLKQRRAVRVGLDELEETTITDNERIDYLERKADIELQDIIVSTQGIKELLKYLNERYDFMDNSVDSQIEKRGVTDFDARKAGARKYEPIKEQLEELDRKWFNTDVKYHSVAQLDANNGMSRQSDLDFIMVALVHILEKCANYNVNLFEKTHLKIRSSIVDLLENAKSICEKNDGQPNGLLDNWSIYLVATVIASVVKHVHSAEDSIESQNKDAEDLRETISSMQSQKTPELKSAVENATRCIKNAYKKVAIEAKKPHEMLSNYRESDWALVPDMLEWAGRFSLSEHRLVQAEKTKKLQKNLVGTEGVVSPKITYYFFLMYYARTELRKQKEVIKHLNKLKKPLSEHRKDLFVFEDNCRYDGMPVPQVLVKLKGDLLWFDTIVSEKLIREIVVGDKLEDFYERACALQTSVYFSVLKERCYKPKEQSERHKAVRAAREKLQLRIEASEHQIIETKLVRKKPGHRSDLTQEGVMDCERSIRAIEGKEEFEMAVNNLTLENLYGKMNLMKSNYLEMKRQYQGMLNDSEITRSENFKSQSSSNDIAKGSPQYALLSEILRSPGKGTEDRVELQISSNYKFIGGSNRFAPLSDDYYAEYDEPDYRHDDSVVNLKR